MNLKKGEKRGKENKKRSLLVTLLLGIGATIFLLNMIQTLIVASNLKRSITKGDIAKYSEMVQAYALAIENDFEGYFSALDYYVHSDIMKEGSVEEMAEWLEEHEGERNSDFDYIMLAGPDGKSYNDIGTRTDIAQRSYFKAIMQEGKDRFIDNPVISKTTGQPVVHVTRAIKRNGRNIAMLCGVVNVNLITKEVNAIQIGDNGYAWVLASDGMVISHKTREYIMNKNFITGLSEGHEDMAEVASKIASCQDGSAWVNGLGYRKDLICYSGIKATGWGLAITVPDTQVYYDVNSVRKYMFVFGTIVILLTIIIGGVIVHMSIKPLKVVEEAITGIASGNADLTRRIEINSNNEIGFVVKGFNAFAQKLQSIISDVKHSKEELSIAGEDMSASAQDTASSITEIIANIDSMRNQIVNQSASVTETASAVNEIAANINSLEKMIESQSAGVTQASAAVEQMIGNISSVNQSVEKMASSFEALETDASNGFSKQQSVNDRIKQIETQSEMLKEANIAISNIAEQTNLLAMNAAIEAAHAGEAGKGFAVVADEIRKLSETSTSQSKTIGEQLNNIKESINSVVQESLESSKAFESVSLKIQDTDQLVLQIKSAMEEQTTGSQQISEALQHMNDSTVQVRNASEEMTEGNKAILEEVQRLQNATTSMKESMDEMVIGAKKINETGTQLEEISGKVKEQISLIGEQIDQFKV